MSGIFEPQRQKKYLRICAPIEDSDQPAHSRDLIRLFTDHILDSQGCKFLHADNEDRSDCADAQADLSVCLVHMSEGAFSHVAYRLFCRTNRTNVSKMANSLAAAVPVLLLFSGTQSPSPADEQRLQTDVFLTYNKNVRPVIDLDDSVRVHLDIVLLSINGFDDISGEIAMTTVLTFQWKEHRIKWKRKLYNNVSSLVLPYNEVWRPRVFLENAADKMTEIGKDSVLLRIGSHGDVLWMPGQVLKFTCSVNVKYYPFDTQSCQLLFSTWSYYPSEVEFDAKPTGFNLTFYSENPQWVILSKQAKTIGIGKQNSVKYTFVLKRRSQFFIIYIIWPIIFLGVLNDLVFIMPVSSGERISVAITAYLSYVVYMGIINENVPENSDSIPVVFIYLLLRLAHSSLIMILSVISSRIHDSDGSVKTWIQTMIKTLRFQNCCRRSIKVSSQIHRENAVEMNDATDPVRAFKEERKNATIVKEGKQITWTDVGNTFDIYMFLLVTFLHGSLSFGFIYSIYVNDVLEI